MISGRGSLEDIMKKRWCVAAVLVLVLPLLGVAALFLSSSAIIRQKRDMADVGARLTSTQEWLLSVADFWAVSWYVLAPVILGAAVAGAVACLLAAFRRPEPG
jgi:hypothetical protein